MKPPATEHAGLRRATKPDLPALLALEQACFGHHSYPDFFFRQALDCWGDQLWLAEQDGEVLGYLLMAPGQQQEGWILALAVAEAARGRGLARALLNRALSEAGRYARLKLTVDPANTPALALYQSLGFATVAQEPDYFGPDSPRLVLAWTP